MLVEKYQHYIITLFLFGLVVIMNLNINKKHKLILLLVALIFCIYQPKYLIPFLISIALVYLANRKLKKINTATKETFQNRNPKIENLIKLLKEIHQGKVTYSLENEKEILDLLKNENINKSELSKIDDKILLRTSFLKDISQCYFFNHKDPINYSLMIQLNRKFKNVRDLQNRLKFIDITKDINFDEEVDDENRNKKLNLLSGKTFKKLGLLFYNSPYINVSELIEEIIKDFSLYINISGKYNIPDEDLKFLNKKVYELVIYIIQFNLYDTNQFNFNKKIDVSEINLYNIIDKIGAKPKEYNKIKSRIGQLNTIKLKIIYPSPSQTNSVKEAQEPTEEEIKPISVKSLFPGINYILKKSVTINIKSNNTEKIIDQIINNLSEESELDNFLESYFEEINLYYDSLELLDFSYHRVKGNRNRYLTEMKVKSNYFLLYLISGNLDNLLKKIKKNNFLDKALLNLYTNKSKVFKKQIEQEELIKQKYNFTGIEDLFYDNLFFYYGILTKQKNNFTRIFIEKEDIEGPVPSKDEDDIKNSFSEYQQKNFELGLDDYLTKDQVKEKQEEALVKYYKFLDKENYEKISTLGKLATERNKELKINKLSFDSVIDNFGKETYSIIDELVKIISRFYKNEGLEEIKDILNNNLDNPTFEGFSSMSPSSSDAPSDTPLMTSFDKYILFLKSIINILFKQDRIMYVGFIFIVLALFLYFIDSGESYQNVNTSSSKGINSIFDLLRL